MLPIDFLSTMVLGKMFTSYYFIVLYDIFFLLIFLTTHLPFSDENMKDELAGCTALVLFIKNNKLYCVSSPLLYY